MSPPIYTPDGSEVSEIVLPDGSTASQVIGPDGNVVFEAGPDIPDSVVSRDPDNDSFTSRRPYGVQFTTDVEWEEIGAKLSANVVGATTAYVYESNSTNLMGQTDISALSGGETFTITLDTPLSVGGTYDFVVDNGGSVYTVGRDNAASYPYTSSDGDLEITTGVAADDGSTFNSQALNIRRLGNVGF